MGVIVPAVLPSSRTDLEEKLARFEGLADAIQIDVIDGRFAAPASWPYTAESDAAELAERAAKGDLLPKWGTFTFDIDLMVSNPEEVAGSWILLGASRITIHLESTTNLSGLIDALSVRYGHAKDFAPDLLSFGVALGLSADLSILEPYLPHVDYVQFMGIRTIGKQGEPFDPRVVDRVKRFRARHPDMKIQVDGGVSKSTAPALLAAGVDRLIVGSALERANDVRAEFNALTALTQEYGLYES